MPSAHQPPDVVIVQADPTQPWNHAVRLLLRSTLRKPPASAIVQVPEIVTVQAPDVVAPPDAAMVIEAIETDIPAARASRLAAP